MTVRETVFGWFGRVKAVSGTAGEEVGKPWCRLIRLSFGGVTIDTPSSAHLRLLTDVEDAQVFCLGIG